MAPEESDERLDALMTFLKRMGVHYDDNVIRFCKSGVHGYGVIACAAINTGHTVASIPKSAVLSVQTASLWQDINKNGNNGDNTVDDDYVEWNRSRREEWCPPLFQLAAAVLFERAVMRTRSRWHEYMDLLPKSLVEIGVPMAYKDTTLRAWFGGTGVDCMAGKMRKMVKEVFDSCIWKLFAHRGQELGFGKDVTSKVTYEQFLVAFGCVTSRAFQVDEYHGSSMVPVADMFNHGMNCEHVHIEEQELEGDIREGNSCSGAGDTLGDAEEEEGVDYGDEGDDERDEKVRVNETEEEKENCEEGDEDGSTSVMHDAKGDNGDLVVRCVRDVKSGDEVFNTFGQKGNTLLYLNYGFTDGDNGYDSALVHKDDVAEELRIWCNEQQLIGGDGEYPVTWGMSKQRQECIETASVVIEDEAIDEYLEIRADGTLCHGLWVVIYLHVVRWADIVGISGDDVDLLEHVRQISTVDVMEQYGVEVKEIVRRVIARRTTELEAGRNCGDMCTNGSGSERLVELEPEQDQPQKARTVALQTAAERIYSGQLRALQQTHTHFLSKDSTDSGRTDHTISKRRND